MFSLNSSIDIKVLHRQFRYHHRHHLFLKNSWLTVITLETAQERIHRTSGFLIKTSSSVDDEWLTLDQILIVLLVTHSTTASSKKWKWFTQLLNIHKYKYKNVSKYINADSHAKQKLCCFLQVLIAKCSRVTFYRRNL